MRHIKRGVLFLLAVLMIVSVFTISAAAKRGYSTISTKNVALEFPDEDDFLTTMKTARVKASRSNGSIYIMPRPASGHGNLGNALNNELVYLIAKTDSYYFFVTKEGHFGWNGTKYFKVKNSVYAGEVMEVIEDSEASTIFNKDDDYEDFMTSLLLQAEREG